ncbi:uncharacterized protein THITE_2113026 [Thermothielavioides terrestris NRRL 8126]|uniref:RING zinc finger-like domain-containing protein n=1 Tax=Thermothielavioides terrestris (strain ATCC 38088 / NRRL 8126) TaxID=578455 RepID=G2R1I4_THETT|nr:uncharacterized protein THITE_2113026 [Thermothielavioides terrestris NRRL 8126]AEO65723.1 hypothetical protein THITE_2113026 [Thermothielavioides terrestris NRRL 8126]
MPPRSSLTSSFSITDANNEVVCPLRNQDGSSCRKRCIGEKRYRSMQEHIRRAHPEHYIAKLPATEESFLLMINTSPSERQQAQPSSGPPHAHPTKGPSHDFRRDDSNGPGTPRRFDEYAGGTMYPAAAALAQLHNHKSDLGWDSDGQDWHSDTEGVRISRSSVELPPIHLSPPDVTSAPLPSLESARQRDLLPSIMANSPPGRSSTLPPLHRPLGPNRPRKQSISKRFHHRRKSKGPGSDWLRRIQNDGNADLLRPGGHDRKALSAEPSGDFGKRWEDLIDAAASATEDIDEDRTPVSLRFPSMLDPRLTSQMPQSPVSIQRSSLPPFTQGAFANYQASPLQRALTPPSYNPEAPEPFPSVESGESGDNFHMGSRGLSNSSPSYSSQNTQIYCAACQGVSLLRESYACTECICGLCQACVDVLMGEQGARRKCPRCATIGGRFKPFQLDIR